MRIHPGPGDQGQHRTSGGSWTGPDDWHVSARAGLLAGRQTIHIAAIDHSLRLTPVLADGGKTWPHQDGERWRRAGERRPGTNRFSARPAAVATTLTGQRA